jgi:DNA-binding LacI/PurR family transcriptional regulator
MTATKSKEAPAEVTKPQMADVAALAGVSVATVSRALAGSTLVNEATRTRIQELARGLNYSINIAAQNLRLQQNRTIAVVLPFDFRTAQTASDPFFIGLLGSIADAVTARGYEMLLSRINAEQINAAANLVQTGRASGVVLVGQWHQHAQINQLGSLGFPLVVWGARMPDQTYCTIGSNNELGGKLAAQHLLAQGRKRIAFLGDTELPEVAQRFAGFKLAMDEARIAVDPALLIPAPFVAESGRHAIELLIKRQLSFDAVVACSDLLAMTAIQALQAHGRTVPEDVAVIGYDDVSLASYFHPSISTISQHVETAGEALVSALFSFISGKKAQSLFLKTELVARESTRVQSPAPKRKK